MDFPTPNNQTRDEAQIQRINTRFGLLSLNMGFTLHPLIYVAMPTAPKIADLAAWTGAFLDFMRGERPQAELHGFDVDGAFFPRPEHQVASRIQYHIMDYRLPVHQVWYGHFDVVHIRMVAAALRTEADWRAVLGNATQMLKPGGWLQWTEIDPNSGRHLRGDFCEHPSAHRDGMSNAGYRTPNGDNFRRGWDALPTMMSSLGMTCRTRDIVSSDRLAHTRTDLTQIEATHAYILSRRLVERHEVTHGSLPAIDAY